MIAEPTWEMEWIDTEDALARVAEQLATEEILAVDTETWGWKENKEFLCLIQIGAPELEKVFLIDVLACKDLSALAPIIEGETPALIAHNASFEARQFSRHGLEMRGEIDTLDMARELRPDLPNHQLATCCRALLGIELSKEEQTSDWSVRPLSDQQLIYAQLDAELAFELYYYLADLEEQTIVDDSLSVPELMRQLAETYQKRWDLLDRVAEDASVLDVLEQQLRACIREKLESGEEAYKGEWGECSLQRYRELEVDPEKVRQRLPELASELIEEHVDKTHLREVLKEHGLAKDIFEELVEEVGENFRLKIKPKPWI